MIHKRGQVANQFNWVFAIIAGGIILLFFLFVVNQVRSASDAELAATVINNFDAVITGSLSTPNTLHTIESTESVALQVTCDNTGLSEIVLVGSSARIDSSQKVIISPNIISGREIYVYTLPIRKPFYISNSLLITEPKTLFLFIPGRQGTSNDNLNRIKGLFPEEISLDFSGIINQEHTRYDKIVILSDSAPTNINNNYETVPGERSLRNKNVNWIHLQFQSDNSLSSASFYNKEARSNEYEKEGEIETPNDDFALFLAFSPSIEFYECSMRKVSNRMRTITQIYLERTKMLSENSGLNNACRIQYSRAETILEDLLKSDKIFDEDSLVRSLENANRALMLASCPMIY